MKQWNFKESSMEGSKCYPGAKVQCHLWVNWECQPRCAAISKGCAKEKWALSFDKGYRYGAMTTKVFECFNGVLKGARNLPITTMVKYTLFKLNSYFDDRHNKSIAQLNSGQKWTKYALDIFMRNKAKAEHHWVMRLKTIISSRYTA